MKLSNAFLIFFVWAVALTMMAVSFANAQPPATPIYSMRGWDDSGSIYMWFDVGFKTDGNSIGGNVWLMDADRIPIGTDPLLLIGGNEMSFDFAGTQLFMYNNPAGSVDGSLNDLFVVHNGDALALDFTDTLSGQWLVPEPSALLLGLLGMLFVGAMVVRR